MTSKIRIKMGDVEVEYEGSEGFLRDELKELLSGVVELHREHGETSVAPLAVSPTATNTDVETTETFKGTTNTVAAKLNVTSGVELIIAAMARRRCVLGQETSTRAQILSEMKSAASYYKVTYSKNLSGSLKRLVSSDRLREISKDTYSLSAGEILKIQEQLDN